MRRSPLTIASNGVLTSLAGLESLTSAGYLSIESNGALTSLLGLEKLRAVEGALAVYSNAALPACWVLWLQSGLTTLGAVGDTSDNGGEGTCSTR